MNTDLSHLTPNSKGHRRDLSRSLSNISHDAEWKQSPTRLVTLNNFANKGVTKEVEEEEDQASDSFQAVNIVDKTLEDDTGDLADLVEPYEHSSPSDSPDQSPERDQDASGDKIAY